MRVYLWPQVQGVLFPDDPADVAAVLAIARNIDEAQRLLDEYCEGVGPALHSAPAISRKVDDRDSDVWVFHRATELGD